VNLNIYIWQYWDLNSDPFAFEVGTLPHPGSISIPLQCLICLVVFGFSQSFLFLCLLLFYDLSFWISWSSPYHLLVSQLFSPWDILTFWNLSLSLLLMSLMLSASTGPLPLCHATLLEWLLILKKYSELMWNEGTHKIFLAHFLNVILCITT
jgi:hypothetical protein